MSRHTATHPRLRVYRGPEGGPVEAFVDEVRAIRGWSKARRDRFEYALRVILLAPVVYAVVLADTIAFVLRQIEDDHR